MRSQASASTSPRNAQSRRPPRHVHVTATVASVTGWRRSLTTCTSMASSLARDELRRQRIGDDDQRPAGLDHGRPGQLRAALVVEHGRRDHRGRVGQPRERRTRRPAGTSAAAASRSAGAAGGPGSAASPAASRRTSGARRAGSGPSSRRSRGRGGAARPSQSSRGHARGSTNSSAESGTAWAPNSLTKRTIRGSSRGPLGEVADLAAVPAQPEVAVGAVERRAGGAARRRGRRSAASGRPARTPA